MTDFVAGDSGSSVVFQCINKSDGLPIDLTGATVHLKFGAADRLMTITNAAEGVVAYQFQSTELVSPSMLLEVEIVDALGNLISILDKVKILVRAA